MAEGTKERILRIALELFAQNGYLGTSMNDIARQVGFTKAALYKHYASKQEILDKIVERMNKMDYERAEAYEMSETEPDDFAEAYLHTPVQKIRTYSLAQFDHWTKEPFSSNFRKMLTLEQYRDPKLAQLHQASRRRVRHLRAAPRVRPVVRRHRHRVAAHARPVGGGRERVRPLHGRRGSRRRKGRAVVGSFTVAQHLEEATTTLGGLLFSRHA